MGKNEQSQEVGQGSWYSMRASGNWVYQVRPSLGVPMQGNSKSKDADVTVCERMDAEMREAGQPRA